ncbi:hypothetical protein QTG56_25625 (plasmid) [Rossellomorea sp. AcN35-11]|nr:hypothetical protein [Rossellomorea aquimaris]WJV31996.1 hypothetical protein QTG56_25625 [Rossellomorea sp. AcN35-11]
MDKLKLSELEDDVEVAVEDSHTVYTVAELKKEIIEMGEESHLSNNWYTIKKRRWEPDAGTMVENYLENESCDLYEDFYSVSMDEMEKGAIERIQSILDETFKSKSICSYWTYEKPVEIDVLPI